jgi:hypothetical protein
MGTMNYNNRSIAVTVDPAPRAWLRRLTLILVVNLACLGGGGCWNVIGHHIEWTAPTLLDAAVQAQNRGDERAARTMLRRVVEEFAETPEADIARQLLLEMPPQSQGLLRPAAR